MYTYTTLKFILSTVQSHTYTYSHACTCRHGFTLTSAAQLADGARLPYPGLAHQEESAKQQREAAMLFQKMGALQETCAMEDYDSY